MKRFNNGSLQKDLDRYRYSSADSIISQLEDYIFELEEGGNFDDLKDEISRLENDLSEAEDKIYDLEQEIIDLKREISELEDQIK